MNANTPREPDASELPEPVVRSGKRQISIVWLVPVVAILIGGWLIYKAISEKGPEVTITFNTAEGLEAGKTKIKCKDVEIGLVEEISLSKDLTQVIVKAQLVREADSFLSENSRFWVVRARVSASSVTGLGTVFSGAYIDIDPGAPGKPARHFAGLEDPPIVKTWEKGRHFTLVAERKGSLDIGSPVYYRQLEVGRVAAYNMAPDGSSVTFKVFIRDPYPGFVRKNTRFWNASGIDVKMDAQGIQVNTESFVSILVGGLAFDVIESFGASTEPAAIEDEPFTLYPSREAAREKTYVTKRYYLLHFTTSVRGLSLGAPVEFRGIPVGHVVDLKLEFDPKKMTFDIPVIIVIEPGRIYIKGTENRTGEAKQQRGKPKHSWSSSWKKACAPSSGPAASSPASNLWPWTFSRGCHPPRSASKAPTPASRPCRPRSRSSARSSAKSSPSSTRSPSIKSETTCGTPCRVPSASPTRRSCSKP